ncbi:hypothetical protein WJX79_006003 [Trebouxia sp. C0005]
MPAARKEEQYWTWQRPFEGLLYHWLVKMFGNLCATRPAAAQGIQSQQEERLELCAAMSHVCEVVQEASQTTKRFTAQDECRAHQLFANDRCLMTQHFSPMLAYSVSPGSLVPEEQQHVCHWCTTELDARARLALNGCVSQTAGPRSQTGAHTQPSAQVLHTKLSQAPGVATQSSPGRHFLGASRDSNKPAPAGDIRSAARIDSLKRIAGFVVGAGVFLSFEPVPVVGGPQLVFGIFKPAVLTLQVDPTSRFNSYLGGTSVLPCCAQCHHRCSDAAVQSSLIRTDSGQAEVKNRVSSIMLDLRSCVAKQLWASRDEWGQWISDHPHWEYRIGRVKQLLKDVPPLPELSLLDKQTLATRRKDAKQLIKQYQDSKDWPEALAYLTFTYTNPRTCFEVAEKLRRMSPEAQRQMAAEDASREYDLQTRLAVLGMSIRHTDFGCKFERCFKAAMQLFRGQSQQAKA